MALRINSKRKSHLRFFEAFEDGRELMMVMEHLAGGELFDKIAAVDELLESDCCSYIRQICQVGNDCGG